LRALGRLRNLDRLAASGLRCASGYAGCAIGHIGKWLYRHPSISLDIFPTAAVAAVNSISR